MSDFTYLSLHTHFSRAGGPASPAEWSARARELGYASLGIADRAPLSGWPAFHLSSGEGITPIYGMEADLALPPDSDRKSRTQTDPLLQGALLIARSPEGARNLAALASVAYSGWPSNEAPITWDALTAHAAGLIVILLGGDEAGALQPIAEAEPKRAQSWVASLKTAFNDALYIGLPHSGRPGDAALAETISVRAAQLTVPMVALPTARYLQPADAPAYEALKIARARAGWPGESASATSIASDREGFDYLRPPGEVEALYAKWPESLRNVGIIAQQASEAGAWPFATPDATSGAPNSTLLELARTRLQSTSALTPEAEQTLSQELTHYQTWGSAGAHSALASIAQHASNPQAAVPVGSSIGFVPISLLSYALGLSTSLPTDPPTLPEGQPTSPALPGVTLPSAGRAALLQQLAEEYGYDRVAYASCSLEITPIQAIAAAGAVLSIEGDPLRAYFLPALESGWKSLQPLNVDIPPTKLASLALSLKGAPLTFTPDHDTVVVSPRSIYGTSTLSSWSPVLVKKSEIPSVPWSAESLASLGYPAIHLPSSPTLDTLYAALQLARRNPVPDLDLAATTPDELITALKTQHPAAYFAGALGTAWQRGEASAVLPIAEEAHKHDLKIEPPHVNFSQLDPTLQRDGTSWSILWGIANLPNWTPTATSRFIASRPQTGFPSLAALVLAALSVDLTQSHLTTLILAGACDTLGDRPRDRYALLSALPAMFDWASSAKQASSTRPNLFAAPADPSPTEDDLNPDNAQTTFGAVAPVLPPHVRFARRQWERENLGVQFTDAEEIEALVATLDHSGALGSRLTSTADITSAQLGTTIHTVGLLCGISLVSGKDNETLAIGSIEDTQGSIELLAFPPNYKRHSDLWAENTLVAVTARVEAHPEGDLYLLCEHLAPFSASTTDESFSITIKAKTQRAVKEPPPPKPTAPLYPSRPDLKIIPPPPAEPVRAAPPPLPTGPATYSVIISIPDADEDQTVIDSLIDLKRLLEQHPGSDNVTIRIPYLRGKWTTANLTRGVRYSHQLENQLHRLLGNDSVAVIQLAS